MSRRNKVILTGVVVIAIVVATIWVRDRDQTWAERLQRAYDSPSACRTIGTWRGPGGEPYDEWNLTKITTASIDDLAVAQLKPGEHRLLAVITFEIDDAEYGLPELLVWFEGDGDGDAPPDIGIRTERFGGPLTMGPDDVVPVQDPYGFRVQVASPQGEYMIVKESNNFEPEVVVTVPIETDSDFRRLAVLALRKWELKIVAPVQEFESW